MGEEEKNPNPFYIGADLVEDIFVRLPLKSILRFKTVSRQWRSTLESRRFAEMRMSVQKNHKRLILAVGNRAESRRFQGDAEMEIVYLECDDATRPSLTCNGLLCFPEPDRVNVLNPLTGEYLRFHSGPSHYENDMCTKEQVWWSRFKVYSAMGFGRDQVNGNYKVVSMSNVTKKPFQILDVNIGEWRKLVPPPYLVEPRRKSACVNGSIYWLTLFGDYKILALDLHTEEFRHVPVPPLDIPQLQPLAHIVNLEDRLAMADTTSLFHPEWKLEIWVMDAQEASWSKSYSIDLSHRFHSEDWDRYKRWYTPVAVSKQGSLFFCDNEKNLFKYDPETDFLRWLSSDVCVISPFVENWVRLQPGSLLKTGYRYGRRYLGDKPCSRISSIVGRIMPNIIVTSTLVSLICFGFRFRYRT